MRLTGAEDDSDGQGLARIQLSFNAIGGAIRDKGDTWRVQEFEDAFLHGLADFTKVKAPLQLGPAVVHQYCCL